MMYLSLFSAMKRMRYDEVPGVVFNLMRGYAYPPRSTWASRKNWTAEEASWLAVNIDPGFIDPWRISNQKQETVKPLLAIIANELCDRVGEKAHPSKFIKAIADMGIEQAMLDKGINPVWYGENTLLEAKPDTDDQSGNQKKPASTRTRTTRLTFAITEARQVLLEKAKGLEPSASAVFD
jgi:hypothetical protein